MAKPTWEGLSEARFRAVFRRAAEQMERELAGAVPEQDRITVRTSCRKTVELTVTKAEGGGWRENRLILWLIWSAPRVGRSWRPSAVRATWYRKQDGGAMKTAIGRLERAENGFAGVGVSALLPACKRRLHHRRKFHPGRHSRNRWMSSSTWRSGSRFWGRRLPHAKASSFLLA